MVIQFCEYTENHWMVHSKKVNFLGVNYVSTKLLFKNVKIIF